jgi:hypothetical protein
MSNENFELSAVGQQSYVIFAFDAGKIPHKGAAFVTLHNLGVDAKAVKGAYRMRDNGKIVREPAYVIAADKWASVLDTGLVKNQESILVLGPKASRDAHRPATLHFLPKRLPEGDTEAGGLPVFLGYFVDCDKKIAMAQDGWTEDDGVFYACFHDPDDAQE